MANHYQLPEPTATAVPSLTGRFLAHNRHDHVAHAFFAGDLVLGKIRLVQPTVTQAAFLAGVNRTYVHWALKRQAERGAIEAGLVPLVPPPHMAAKTNGTAPTTESGIVDSGLVQFVRSVGINRVLEAAIAAEATQ
jgi:hypothetical protein